MSLYKYLIFSVPLKQVWDQKKEEKDSSDIRQMVIVNLQTCLLYTSDAADE